MSDEKQEYITWTPSKLREFKKVYKAFKDHKASFKFEGNEYYPGYAKYLIEFLEGRFKIPADKMNKWIDGKLTEESR